MIKQEPRQMNGHEFIYTYSDADMMIKQVGTGEMYMSAYDLPQHTRSYTETDVSIMDYAKQKMSAK